MDLGCGKRDERDEGLYVGYRLWGLAVSYRVVYTCHIEIGEMQAPLERYPTSNLGQRGPTLPRVSYLFFSFRRISPSFSPRGLGLGLRFQVGRTPRNTSSEIRLESGKFYDLRKGTPWMIPANTPSH